MEVVSLSAPLREKEGFYYLEIPKSITESFMPLIQTIMTESPKSVTDPDKYVGPHISVIMPEESKRIKKTIKEIGANFDFTIAGLHSCSPENWHDVKEVFFITVHSISLESLRRRLKLRSKPKGQDFHITLAVVPYRSIPGKQ